jgi:hypothetical protein
MSNPLTREIIVLRGNEFYRKEAPLEEINSILANFTRLVDDTSDEVTLRNIFTFIFYLNVDDDVDEHNPNYTLPPENSVFYQELVIVYNKLKRLGNTDLLYVDGITIYFNIPQNPKIDALHDAFIQKMESEPVQSGPTIQEQPDVQTDTPKPVLSNVSGGKKSKRKQKSKPKSRKSNRKSKKR